MPYGEIGFPSQGGSPQAALVEDEGEAAFDELTAFAHQGFATGGFDGAECFVKDLLDDGALGFLAALGGVGITDDGAASHAADLLDAEVAFVGG